MSPIPPPLKLSQIIASDAPLLSPVDDEMFDQSQEFYNYYLPPSPPQSVGSASNGSPIPATRMLRNVGPGGFTDTDMCMPTSQVFNFQHHIDPQLHYTPVSTPSCSPRMHGLHLPMSISPSMPSVSMSKRSASPDEYGSAAPKKRTVGERISTKDFVPPDVSGLSKREARLVKNRAAAFLSRQRKREEFEWMEGRVTDLEKENQRLLAIAQGKSTTVQQPADDLVSEVEQLRAKLAASEERERALIAELAASKAEVKQEFAEQALNSFPKSSSASQPQHKASAAAGLGLMVLLCALPSLMTMPGQGLFSHSLSISSPISSPTTTSFDFRSFVPPEYDSWSSIDSAPSQSHLPPRCKLEFANLIDSRLVAGGLGDLSALNISFTSSTEDGKVRVRIYPTGSAPSKATFAEKASSSPLAKTKQLKSSSEPLDSSAHHSSLWQDSGDGGLSAVLSNSFGQPSSSFSPSYSTGNSGDPFLGSNGVSSHYGYDLGMGSSDSMMFSGMDYGNFGSDFSSKESCKSHRVRIALKSMPTGGEPGDGGEWEVQFC